MIINGVVKNCFDILGSFGKFFEKDVFTQRILKENVHRKLCVLLLVLSPTSWAYDEKWYAAIQTEVLFDTPEQACEQYPIATINPSCTYSRTERVYDGLNLSNGSCMYLCGNNPQEQNLVNAGKRICFRESQMFVLNNGVWTCTDVIKPDTPDMGPANPPAQCSAPKKGVGNPINVTNGNKYQREVDFVFVGPSTSLNLIRHYNSLNDSVGPFGRGWSADFGVKVEEFEVYDSPPSDPSEEPLKLMQIVSVSTGRRLEFESINGSYQVLTSARL